jgi:hypothetical protein
MFCRIPKFACVAGAAAVLLACSGERAPAPSTTRDSAGVQIVENVHRDSADVPWWRLDSLRVDIGAAEGDESAVLFRAIDAVRLSDGRIAIVLYVTLAPDGGAIADTLATAPGAERVVNVSESGGIISSVSIVTPPFARATIAVPSGNELIVGTQNAPELLFYNRQGSLRRIVRMGTPEIRVTPELVEEYMTRRMSRVAEDRREATRTALMGVLSAQVVPPYGAIVVDRSGSFWVQHYPDLADLQRWSIYDDGGAFVARITLPARFTPYDIGDDWILGGEPDELDVEHMRMYALRRSVN